MDRLLALTVLLGLGLGATTPTLAQGQGKTLLSVGTCKRDITPVTPQLVEAFEDKFGVPAVVNHTDPVFLAGFGDNRLATGYHDQLWARGVVLGNQDTRVAIVSVDLVGFFKNEVDTVRSMISSASGIDFAVISATNQAEGPDTIGVWGPNPLTTGIDFGYLDFVNTAIADCIDEAADNLQPARVYYATASSVGLSLGLDVEDDGFGVGDGKVLVDDESIAPDTEGRIVDPNLGVIQLTGRSEPFEVLATIVNFGSHPESLGSGNTLITSDFPHYVRRRIEAEYDGLAIWLSGALGVLQGPLDIDVMDPETGQPAPRRTFRFAEVHGTQLAERAIAAIDGTRLNRDGIPSARNGDVSPRIIFSSVDPVPVRLDNPFLRFFIALGVINVRLSLFTDGSPDPSVGFPFDPPFDTIPQALGEDIHTEVSLLQIGDASFAIVPTKLDPQIGAMYRQHIGTKHTYIIAGNDAIGSQLLADKWDDSCHACAPYIIAGGPQLCPLFPAIDCNVVFRDSAGADVDPSITDALEMTIPE